MATVPVDEALIGYNTHRKCVSFIRGSITNQDKDFVFVIGRIPPESIIYKIDVCVADEMQGAKIKFGSTEKCDDYSEADVSAKGLKSVTIPNTKLITPTDKDFILHAKCDKNNLNKGYVTIIAYFIPKEQKIPAHYV